VGWLALALFGPGHPDAPGMRSLMQALARL